MEKNSLANQINLSLENSFPGDLKTYLTNKYNKKIKQNLHIFKQSENRCKLRLPNHCIITKAEKESNPSERKWQFRATKNKKN